ncbi:prolyl oligopeptidase family serine peptidase [Brevundimonas aveniformis]|uniref:prolyl oligopeptidase family serine peptidase n=1 Tax=Brevundimonas aveniformis TaxID=370977 RepID=UPI002492E4E8|nr:prolyl oligopeptidase family serine peptidase [Brevundimonas aveniformis]
MRTLALAALMATTAPAAFAQTAAAVETADLMEQVGYGHPSDASGIADLQPIQIAGPAMPTDLTPEGVAAADAYLWLEDVNADRSMDWVRAQNAQAHDALETDPRFETFRDQAYGILSATDRIALPHMQDGMVFNFWQDDDHPKGLWRRASPDSYRAGTPQWETVLDIGALAEAEGRDWVFKGADCYGPVERLCLIALSDGGGDAVVVREFDTHAGTFVEGGFSLPMGKHRYDWLDADTLLVATDFGEVDGQPSLTESGYPYIVRALRRGQTLAEAETVFAGEQGDGGYGVNPSVYRGPDGQLEAVLINRPLDTFRSETYALIDGQPDRLSLPERATVWGAFGDRIIFSIEQPWQWGATTYETGSLMGVGLNLLAQDEDTEDPIIISNAVPLIFAPSGRQSIEDVEITRDRVVVSMFDNVVGQLRVFANRGEWGWPETVISVPDNATVTLVDAGRSSNQIYYSVEGFLTPTTLMTADAGLGEMQRHADESRTLDLGQVVASMPARFDASRDVVEQFEARSSDGTMIPYFLVRPRDIPTDGSTGTILYGYGGFQISKPADYIPEMGRLWLENGGVFVIANIRGGGEFGPAWHQAALRENRQRAFDDFAAVAEDLIARGVTSPEHLGIYGRSNGGVLTSVSVTQRPDLFNAAVIESPLIDMLRYPYMPAGASWIGEYGDPRVPEDAAFIARYSAYQNVRPGVADFPRVYITTNTHDDRVHPGHARKFAARLAEYGYDPVYFEDTAGGHSYDADPVANARRWARHYVYFAQQLMD